MYCATTAVLGHALVKVKHLAALWFFGSGVWPSLIHFIKNLRGESASIMHRSHPKPASASCGLLTHERVAYAQEDDSDEDGDSDEDSSDDGGSVDAKNIAQLMKEIQKLQSTVFSLTKKSLNKKGKTKDKEGKKKYAIVIFWASYYSQWL
jgi:hypothetical protein